MWPVAIIAFAVMLMTLVEGVTTQVRDLATLYRSKAQYMRVVSMSENIAQYVNEKAAYPASIGALNATGGFEQTRSLSDTWQGYGVSGTINDGVWQFKRAVLISNDPSKGVNAASYMTSNACGSGDFSTATSWCGSSTGRWFRLEDRERFNNQIMTQRARMSRLLQKLGDYYNTNGTFPDKDALSNTLAANSISTLASLVSYAGSAANCSGSFAYLGVPIDCNDMFDLWGNAVGYQFVSGKHVIVTSETPIFNASGTRVVVAADFDNSLL